ncbi:MAG: hypothetical protein HZB55_17110 [Deltaproteobacteria bacterium]|nr:hypothetical protein [Deltaproteobacteria bacterium]
MTYSYDVRDQLVQSEAGDGSSLITYTYDSVGNRLSLSSQGVTLTTPSVSDTGEFSLDRTSVTVTPTASYGAEYGNLTCELAVGTSCGASDVRDWAPVPCGAGGLTAVDSLNLTWGQPVFASLRVRNFRGDVVSESGCSDGITPIDPAGDDDSDGLSNAVELTILHTHPRRWDTDDDAAGDAADNCPVTANARQYDLDRDGVGDVCDPSVTVEIPLRTGWNLVSIPVARLWYVGPEPATGAFPGLDRVSVATVATVFQSIAGKYTVIRSFDTAGAHVYDPRLPDYLSDLTYVAGGYGCWIKMTEPGVLTLEGRLLPSSMPRRLSAGWNLVGYWGGDARWTGSEAPPVAFPPNLPQESVGSLSEILNGTCSIQVLRSFDAGGAHSYDPRLPDYLNDVTYLGTGYGYWLKVQGDCDLSYGAP